MLHVPQMPPHGQYGTIAPHDCGIHALHALCHAELFTAEDLHMAADTLCQEFAQGAITTDDMISDRMLRVDISLLTWMAGLLMTNNQEPFVRMCLPGMYMYGCVPSFRVI